MMAKSSLFYVPFLSILSLFFLYSSQILAVLLETPPITMAFLKYIKLTETSFHF